MCQHPRGFKGARSAHSMESLTIGDIVERFWQASKNHALCARHIEQGRALLYCRELEKMSRTQLFMEVFNHSHEYQGDDLNRLRAYNQQQIVDLIKQHKERQVGMRMNGDVSTVQILDLLAKLEERLQGNHLWIVYYLEIINKERAQRQLDPISFLTPQQVEQIRVNELNFY